MAGIETNDIFSEDTQRMLEGFNLSILSLGRIEELLTELKEAMVEVKDAINENKDAVSENKAVLLEIKEVLEGD